MLYVNRIIKKIISCRILELVVSFLHNKERVMNQEEFHFHVCAACLCSKGSKASRKLNEVEEEQLRFLLGLAQFRREDVRFPGGVCSSCVDSRSLQIAAPRGGSLESHLYPLLLHCLLIKC